MIGVIGKGFVGGAVVESHQGSIFYDPVKAGSVKDLDDLMECAALYVCVPTPQSVTGECDVSIVKQTLDQLVEKGYKGLVLCKSTAPYLLYESYAHSLRIAFSPEFLRAVSATQDYLKSSFMIVGCETEEVFERVKALIAQSVLPCQTFKRISLREACLVKYFENSYLATKVSLFNEFYQLTRAVGGDWNSVVDALTLDQRIGPDHTQVPGPDGRLGWGGHCLPKDTAALLSIANSVGQELMTLAAAKESNRKIRGQEN